MLRIGSRPQEFILTKITVSDLRRSFDFYAQLVGLKPTSPETVEEDLASTAGFIELGLNLSGSRRDAALYLIRRTGIPPLITRPTTSGSDSVAGSVPPDRAPSTTGSPAPSGASRPEGPPPPVSS